MGLVKKEQLIGFVAGVLISISAGVLGLSASEVKSAICAAPIVQVPK